jgi:hypothetical protein
MTLFDPDPPGACPTCGRPMGDPSARTAQLRRGAHATERAAYFAALPRVGTQRWRVLTFIAGARDGATDDEVGAALGMIDSSENARRGELQQGGWVMDSGRSRLTRAGRQQAIVWVLTPLGRERLAV